MLVSIIIANSSSSISPLFLQLYSTDLLFYGSSVIGRFFTACFKFWLNHILEVSATLCIMRKVCSGSLHVMRIPLYAKKFEARTSPCLSPGALATPNWRFSQEHATERAEGRGVIWGYFHIFTIFRPDLLRYLEQHWGRVSHGRIKAPYIGSMGVQPSSILLLHITFSHVGVLWKAGFWIFHFTFTFSGKTHIFQSKS